ncbi:solute carrier family 22 member 18 [Hydra vulgaris]|uniref:solute carrier family 22 member 18 n=1 Tax=Hydra vulgaris TaxID=6087 RepID=UPI00019254C8|nr:solute carrier family 22 member 18 [Hydra vulgaris]
MSEKSYKEFHFLREFKYFLKGNNTNKDTEEIMLRKKIFVILCACHVVAFAQASGYFIQNNALPYLTKSLGVTPQMYGNLMSFTAIVQLIGGPFCGRLGDLYGGRLPLILSFVCLSITWALLAFATNIPFLFISKLPLVMAHALQSTYLIISDVTTTQQRADMLGKLGVSHGLGMIVGSALGGLITGKLGTNSAFITGSLVMGFCIVVTLILIPKNTKPIRKQLAMYSGEKELFNNEMKSQKCSFMGIKEIIEVAKTRHVGYVLALKVITGIPFSVLSSMFTFIIMEYYHLGPKSNGLVLAYLGIVGMITQGILVGYLTQKVPDAPLIIISVVIMAVGFLYLIIADSIYLFCAVSVPLTIGASLIHVIITSLITKIVREDQTGAALGLTLGCYTLMRTVSPAVGGFFYAHIGFFSFGALGYFIDMMVILYLAFIGRKDFS